MAGRNRENILPSFLQDSRRTVASTAVSLPSSEGFIDAGYGLCRPGIQMFDPGWRGPRARGPEDSGTLDAGADAVGVIERCSSL